MNFKNKIVTTAVASALLASSANAFDITLGGSLQEGKTWRTDATSTTAYNTADTTNIEIRVGHYKNSNREGFGFGWHVGASVPTDFDFDNGGTFDIGIAPGYSITKELALKIELGLGYKKGLTTGYENGFISYGYYEKNEGYLALIYGLSAEYVFSESYIVGGAIKMWNYSAGNGLSDGAFIPELSIGYRF